MVFISFICYNFKETRVLMTTLFWWCFLKLLILSTLGNFWLCFDFYFPCFHFFLCECEGKLYTLILWGLAFIELFWEIIFFRGNWMYLIFLSKNNLVSSKNLKLIFKTVYYNKNNRLLSFVENYINLSRGKPWS